MKTRIRGRKNKSKSKRRNRKTRRGGVVPDDLMNQAHMGYQLDSAKFTN